MLLSKMTCITSGTMILSISRKKKTFLVPFGMFTGNDGSVIIGAPNPKLWMMLCYVMGKSEIAKDPLFATGADRLKNLDKLKVLISESGF